MEYPLITIVISTRNRGDRIVKTVQTIFENEYPHFDLRVIDQSEDDLTETFLRRFRGDPRFHYLRTALKGLSLGRNLGIRNTQSEFIALTDDDCEIPTNWLRELASAFSMDSRIGIIFGNAMPGYHDQKKGFIPSYVRKEPFLARSIFEKNRVEGISACMGLRRSVWQALGGFDEMLGTGAPFRSAEDTDFTIRALLAGYFVYETPNIHVIHQGFRTYEQGHNLIAGYLYGIGAMFFKHLKCKHWSVIHLLFHLMWRWAFERPVVDFGYLPSRWLRLAAFVKRFMKGAITPIDKTKCHYIQRNKRS